MVCIVILNHFLLVYEMVKYAQDYIICRKILFEKYFSLDSTGKEEEKGLVNKITPDQPCGVCDNCTRPAGDLIMEDIREEAKSIIQLCTLLKQFNERVTMIKLVQMLQGRQLGVVKSRVLNNPNMKIPLNKKYTEYVSCMCVCEL
jgi:ATP-dependent DNA helicase Q1